MLLARACAPPRDAAETAGGIFALSTAGNVLGALATTFVLLRFLGTAAAVAVLVGELILAALIARRRSVPVLAGIANAGFPAMDLWIEATQYVERNANTYYRIVGLEDGGRMLDVSGQSVSRHDADGRGWDYVERIERALCEEGETRVLVLGAAGMTLGKEAPCALDVVFVDVDPAQPRIAAQFLGIPVEQAGLRLLANFGLDSERRLCLLLVGQSELRHLAMAHHEALAQRVVVRYHLSGLRREELEPYLRHALGQAGCELALFEPPACQALFQASHGLPRLVSSPASTAPPLLPY